jgi:hypothetical protein
MQPVNQLTWLQVATLTLVAAGIATLIGALWWWFTERYAPNTSDGRINMLWRRIDELEKRTAAQDREIDALREEKQVDRAQIAGLKIELDELYAGVRLLTEQIESAGLVPVWRTHRRNPSSRIAAQATLAGQVAEKFNLDEMSGLAFDIGLEIESVAGQTRPERARQLADAARRLGRLNDLERRIRELRPEG